jgi:predicted ABC-type ATPase
MIAGPNGSGKSTLTNQLIEDGIDLGEYINPDEIAATLTGDLVTRSNAAQRLANARRDDCIAQMRSFSFETVMSHISKIELMKRAGAAGFKTLLYFVGLDDPALNLARVAQRVAQGGHPVPEERILARYQRTMELLPAAIRACDRSMVFDNSRPHLAGGARFVPVLELSRSRQDGEARVSAPYIGRRAQIPGWLGATLVELKG